MARDVRPTSHVVILVTLAGALSIVTYVCRHLMSFTTPQHGAATQDRLASSLLTCPMELQLREAKRLGEISRGAK